MVGSGRATYGTTGDGWVAGADTVEAPAAVVRAPCRAGDLASRSVAALLVVFLPVGHGRDPAAPQVARGGIEIPASGGRSMMCRPLAPLQLTAAIDRWCGLPPGAAPTIWRERSIDLAGERVGSTGG
ncbi:hypothetical protein PVAP13_1KG111307 [Panicum virgatum]|uniref:Uncharacterized protein n=1 Tax=Panicum virgatum TaxID=38727 RepID=A0A8T0XK32_PANVG|nr:hypothetical protein PVAP13_1KG111307 [Panicum virgatum]